MANKLTAEDLNKELRGVLNRYKGLSTQQKMAVMLELMEAGMVKWHEVHRFDDLKGAEIAELARLQRDFQLLDEAAKRIKALFYKVFDFVRLSALPDAMEENNYAGGLVIKDIGRICLTSDMNVTIPAAKREAAYEWLEDNNHGDLITQTINSGTLKAFVKGKIKQGEPVPEELFKITPFTRASITKA